ncbi:MAG: hypothetical protein Cons2KO_15200 [Congregibacter sp.]
MKHSTSGVTRLTLSAGYLLAIGGLLAGQTALAQQEASSASHLFDKKHVFSAGFTRQHTDATIGAAADGRAPLEITLDDLGIDDQDDSYYFEYRYRFKPRWSVFAGAYSFSGKGGRTNSRDFTYDGVEFTAGTELQADLGVDAYIVDVLYSVHRSENLEIMLGGGLHALDLSADIGARLTVGEQSNEFRRAGTTLLAPVPNFRGAATWNLSDNMGFSFVGGWLSANVDNYDGSFSYAHLRAHYSFGNGFGAALGYQITDVDITESRARGDLLYNIELDGPTFTLTYGF